MATNRKTEVFLDAETKIPLPHPVEEKHLLEGDIIQMSREPSTKGKNVSGRSWKVRPQKRASSLVKTKVNNRTKTWEERQLEKNARKEALELQSELREERRQAKVLKKERRLENERRRAENEFKNAQRSAKELNAGRLKSTLKAMSKKQLRQIKKTRMNPKTGTLEYVPAYTK
ncbi:Cgr1 family protein [Nitzschia inconspicua]|uniref:Coiled-coil domain-containing protein 86 n=1 Tax=Nitzschia inconspicua TaxID=303405 RepID=A0A9K3LUJ9_9STRA|nr:Cgr1 family protein [Nitzschia inconspicua]